MMIPWLAPASGTSPYASSPKISIGKTSAFPPVPLMPEPCVPPPPSKHIAFVVSTKRIPLYAPISPSIRAVVDEYFSVGTKPSSFSIAAQASEGRQIDVLNIFNDSSQQNSSGVLTSTNLSGFGMGGDLVFASSNPFGDPMAYPGGISFGSSAGTSTIEVLNILLGEGNDTLDVQGTLNPAPAVSSGGTFSYSGTTITREGPVSWGDFGFLPGQLLSISGVAGNAMRLVRRHHRSNALRSLFSARIECGELAA